MKKKLLFCLTLLLLTQPFGQTTMAAGTEMVQETAGTSAGADSTTGTAAESVAESSSGAASASGISDSAENSSTVKVTKLALWEMRKKTGWVKQNGKKYYLKKGKRATGLKKIKGSYYYFSKRGVLRKKNITVNGMKYLINKKNGKIRGFVMKKKVTPICQQPELPSGCEIVAWTMMVRHAGIKMNKMKAVNLMPRSSNPNAGFVGSPFSSHGYILVVYPGGLMGMTKKYLGSAVNMTGASEEKIQKKLRKGRIVMAWVAGLDGFGSHTIALTGYDDKQIYYNDPWTGTARTMSWSTFRAMWSGNRRRALSY